MESHSPGSKQPLGPVGHLMGKKSRWSRSGSSDVLTSTGRETPAQQHSKKLEDQIVLEHVLGMTVYSNSALTCEPKSGLVAYPAGCVLVLLDTVKNKQMGTLHTPRKSITAASFSSDGRFILTGESGLQPAVRVWDTALLTEIAMLRGHSFGIKTAIFSPRMREIIVVGDAQDMMISVWSWPGKAMNSLNKFSDEIYAMDVSANSQYFVTVGNKHVRFYYLETRRWPGGVERTCPIPLTCRYGMLDNLKENCFCDVACGREDNSYVFVITTSGILCQINSNRFLERWVNVNMETACCLATDGSHVFVGGSQGLIRMFNAFNLKIVLTLPRPHCLGLDIAQMSSTDVCISQSQHELADDPDGAETKQSMTSTATSSTTAATKGNGCNGNSNSCCIEEAKDEDDDINSHNTSGRCHPGAKALTFDPQHQHLTVVYEDHSVYIWARSASRRKREAAHFHKRYSSMYHRGCVWDLTTYPMAPPQPATDSLSDGREEGEVGGALPPGALLSVSADGTLRAWDVSADICQESLLKRNAVSPQCLKIVYGERMEIACLRKVPDAPSDAARKRRAKPQDTMGGAASLRLRKQGFTVVSVCPDGVHIATGNRHGRVSVYDTHTMAVMATMHAHESEVTALGYSITDNYKVLASGSRDRMIHVMDASRGYQLLTTLDDHSSTITAINFTYISHYLIMATSSLDMSVLVRVYMGSDAFILNPVRAIVEKKSIMDFAIHPWSGSMAFACQDRYLRVYSIMTSTDHQSFRGCPTHGGQLVKVQFDPSGQYLLTACSLKTINLLQYATGTLLSTFNGHAESITSIRFSHNVKHVISAAVDGCIFLWRLPDSVTYAVKREMAEMGKLSRNMVFKRSWKKSIVEQPKLASSKSACGVSEVARIGPQATSVTPIPAPVIDHDAAANEELGPCGVDPEQHDPQSLHSQQQLCERQILHQHEQQYFETGEHQHGHEEVSKQPCALVNNTVKKELMHVPKEDDVTMSLTDCDAQGSVSGLAIGPRLEGARTNYLHPVGRLQDDQSTVPKPDAWISACVERRRIFKLEARSIKKILGMMRLVTDAMEKDLANAELLICPASLVLRTPAVLNATVDKEESNLAQTAGQGMEQEGGVLPPVTARDLSLQEATLQTVTMDDNHGDSEGGEVEIGLECDFASDSGEEMACLSDGQPLSSHAREEEMAELMEMTPVGSEVWEKKTSELRDVTITGSPVWEEKTPKLREVTLAGRLGKGRDMQKYVEGSAFHSWADPGPDTKPEDLGELLRHACRRGSQARPAAALGRGKETGRRHDEFVNDDLTMYDRLLDTEPGEVMEAGHFERIESKRFPAKDSSTPHRNMRSFRCFQDRNLSCPNKGILSGVLDIDNLGLTTSNGFFIQDYAREVLNIKEELTEREGIILDENCNKWQMASQNHIFTNESLSPDINQEIDGVSEIDVWLESPEVNFGVKGRTVRSEPTSSSMYGKSTPFHKRRSTSDILIVTTESPDVFGSDRAKILQGSVNANAEEIPARDKTKNPSRKTKSCDLRDTINADLKSLADHTADSRDGCGEAHRHDSPAIGRMSGPSTSAAISCNSRCQDSSIDVMIFCNVEAILSDQRLGPIVNTDDDKIECVRLLEKASLEDSFKTTHLCEDAYHEVNSEKTRGGQPGKERGTEEATEGRPVVHGVSDAEDDSPNYANEHDAHANSILGRTITDKAKPVLDSAVSHLLPECGVSEDDIYSQICLMTDLIELHQGRADDDNSSEVTHCDLDGKFTNIIATDHLLSIPLEDKGSQLNCTGLCIKENAEGHSKIYQNYVQAEGGQKGEPVNSDGNHDCVCAAAPLDIRYHLDSQQAERNHDVLCDDAAIYPDTLARSLSSPSQFEGGRDKTMSMPSLYVAGPILCESAPCQLISSPTQCDADVDQFMSCSTKFVGTPCRSICTHIQCEGAPCQSVSSPILCDSAPFQFTSCTIEREAKPFNLLSSLIQVEDSPCPLISSLAYGEVEAFHFMPSPTSPVMLPAQVTSVPIISEDYMDQFTPVTPNITCRKTPHSSTEPRSDPCLNQHVFTDTPSAARNCKDHTWSMLLSPNSKRIQDHKCSSVSPSPTHIREHAFPVVSSTSDQFLGHAYTCAHAHGNDLATPNCNPEVKGQSADLTRWGPHVVDACIRRHIQLYTAGGAVTDVCHDDDGDNIDDEDRIFNDSDERADIMHRHSHVFLYESGERDNDKTDGSKNIKGGRGCYNNNNNNNNNSNAITTTTMHIIMASPPPRTVL